MTDFVRAWIVAPSLRDRNCSTLRPRFVTSVAPHGRVDRNSSAAADAAQVSLVAFTAAWIGNQFPAIPIADAVTLAPSRARGSKHDLPIQTDIVAAAHGRVDRKTTSRATAVSQEQMRSRARGSKLVAEAGPLLGNFCRAFTGKD